MLYERHYFQEIEKLDVDCNIEPSGVADLIDEFGNEYKAVWWNEKQDKETPE